jgi:phage terminase large subunit-like protein
MDWWDRCTNSALKPVFSDRALPVWVAVDASIKHDSTAIVAVTWDKAKQGVKLVNHRIFQPSPDAPIDFEEMIETTLLEWSLRYKVKSIWFDPYQMIATAQRLVSRHRLPMIEYPQSVPNLTATSQGLFELIKGHNIAVYPDDEIRLAVSRAVAIETPRGWRIGKEKQTHKIDVVVALSMAALAAVRAHASPVQRLVVGTTSADGTGQITWGHEEIDPYRNPLSGIHGGCNPGKGIDSDLSLFNQRYNTWRTPR